MTIATEYIPTATTTSETTEVTVKVDTAPKTEKIKKAEEIETAPKAEKTEKVAPKVVRSTDGAEVAPKAEKVAPKAAAPKKKDEPKNDRMVDPNELIIIGIDTKDDSSHVLWDERVTMPLVEERVANIAEFGIMTPILAIRRSEGTCVVAGRQRVRMAREVNARLAKGEQPIMVPVLYVDALATDAFLAQVMIAENEARQADDIWTKGRKASRLKNSGLDVAAIAVAFAVTKQAVRDWLALEEKLAPAVKDAAESGQISATAALQLTKKSAEGKILSHDEQTAALSTMLGSMPEDAPASAGIRAARENEHLPSEDGTEIEENAKRSNGKKDKKGKKGKKMSKAAAKAAAREATGKGGEAPSQRILGKIIANYEAGSTPQLDAMVVKVIRWVRGEVAPTTIAGLKAAIELAINGAPK